MAKARDDGTVVIFIGDPEGTRDNECRLEAWSCMAQAWNSCEWSDLRVGTSVRIYDRDGNRIDAGRYHSIVTGLTKDGCHRRVFMVSPVIPKAKSLNRVVEDRAGRRRDREIRRLVAAIALGAIVVITILGAIFN